MSTTAITLKGYVWAKYNEWNKKLEFSFWEGNGQSSYLIGEGYMPVVAHTVEVEAPADFNPVKRQVECLEIKKAVLKKEFNERVKEINDQISDLLCLEYKPTEVDETSDEVPF